MTLEEQTVSLYIHIPFCISKCDYCDFFSIGNCKKNKINPLYLTALKNEFNFRLKKYNYKYVKTVYIGGGTPSLLSIEQIKKIITFIEKKLTFTKDYEFTIELNPDDVKEDYVKKLSETKINRISCGFQSMSDAVLQGVHRRAYRKENLQALECIKKFWNKKFSADMISALPYETEESFEEGLKTLVSYKPEHISLYSLTIEDETVLGQKINDGLIEYDYDAADSMWINGRNILEKNGYEQYEVSNFSKKGFECSHNLVYWNHKDYLGLGSGATGSIHNPDGTIFRYTNKNDIEKYINFWLDFDEEKAFDLCEAENEEKIDRDTAKFEFFMMGLRKLSGINSYDYERIFNEKIPEEITEYFKSWKEKGLAEGYALNKKGILFLNKFLENLPL